MLDDGLFLDTSDTHLVLPDLSVLLISMCPLVCVGVRPYTITDPFGASLGSVMFRREKPFRSKSDPA